VIRVLSVGAVRRVLALVGAGLLVSAGVAEAQDAARADVSRDKYSILHSFDGNEGAFPGPLLQASDGAFYGTVNSGAAHEGGAVYRMSRDGRIDTIYAFQFGADGGYPVGGLVEGRDGQLYGVDESAIYKITKSGQLTVLHVFSGPPDDGRRPFEGLILASDGNFYGTTYEGGSADQGTVYRMTPDGVVTLVHSFDKHDPRFSGLRPYATVLQASNGHLYGATSQSGARAGCDFQGGCGGLFELTLDGQLVWGHLLTTEEGISPQSAVIEGRDGNLYGTASFGGDPGCHFAGCGTLFRFSPEGHVTAVRSFHGSRGAAPTAALLQGSDGFLYGTANEANGPYDCCGTVFRVSLGGTLRVLHAFENDPDGFLPAAPLIEASDGSLIGATLFGGLGYGTIYRIEKATATLAAP
jgi:uncharacterized repeat protein (TIGR03803 family)